MGESQKRWRRRCVSELEADKRRVRALVDTKIMLRLWPGCTRLALWLLLAHLLATTTWDMEEAVAILEPESGIPSLHESAAKVQDVTSADWMLGDLGEGESESDLLQAEPKAKAGTKGPPSEKKAGAEKKAGSIFDKPPPPPPPPAAAVPFVMRTPVSDRGVVVVQGTTFQRRVWRLSPASMTLQNLWRRKVRCCISSSTIRPCQEQTAARLLAQWCINTSS